MSHDMMTATQAHHRRSHVLARGHRRLRATESEYSFKVGRKEIGHLHGDRVLHIGFPKEVWARALRPADGSTTTRCSPASRASPRACPTDADVADAVALLRLNYDRAIARHGVAGTAAA